jgi:hypothetical protein
MARFQIPTGAFFDGALAAMAAASAGLVAFAMPDSLFSGLISATPLPDLVPAARPPLGDTARLAAAGAAALFAFALVWGLMAAVERVPALRSKAAPGVREPEAEAPRIRRADAHPDAPARRPLLAAQDLGEPLELEEPLAEEQEPEAPETPAAPPPPLPAFLVEQPEEDEPRGERLAETQAEPEVEPEAEALPFSLAELASRLPRSEPQAEAPLAELVGRIETGMGRKRQALAPSPDPIPEPEARPDTEAEPEPEKVGHRLRSALRDLEKISAQGH